MSDTERLRDAAFATGIDPAWPHAIAGYYGGAAFNRWAEADWDRFRRHKKLPIWVASTGDKSGTEDGKAALDALRDLGVPKGKWTALDMETMVDRTYVEAFGDIVRKDYKVWVYGSASSVFGNPALDGFWVADYRNIGPYMYDRKGAEIRATQYEEGTSYDSSTVKEFTFHDRPRWWI